MEKQLTLFLMLYLLPVGLAHATANVTAAPIGIVSSFTLPPVNCSVIDCSAADQQIIFGNPMFDETNFDSVVDGFGRTRQFWVHLPQGYDSVDGINEKIPVIFVYHGHSQLPEGMLEGKWEEYFDSDIAFVIPFGTGDPCDIDSPDTWMVPKYIDTGNAVSINCDPATQQVAPDGNYISYWNASIPGTFADVAYFESLRTLLMDRFPKLNPNKVYATGYSLGGGMALTLLCYRSNLIKGITTTAVTMTGDVQRGDFDEDGIDEIDPNSFTATCGKTRVMPGHATGINAPRLWGEGNVLRRTGWLSFEITSERRTRPVAVFAGDQDDFTPVDEIEASNVEIRARNNLDTMHDYINPFSNAVPDDEATTQYRNYTLSADITQPSSPYREYLVQGVDGVSGEHGAPDADECNVFPLFFMTCDYSYTDETILFFQEHADLNLNP